jgi:ubiquinone biosynthesis monooxygenase Coq7
VEPARTPFLDRALTAADRALRSLTIRPRALRPAPSSPRGDEGLDDPSRRESGALMRVNHVGEVCAQALYAAQALSTPSPTLRRQFEAAAGDESDHLAWTAERLHALGARPSLLNPVWYLGAFAIGLVAGRAGNQASLGFVLETERQVERHLDRHLERLPSDDFASRAIVQQMKDDEAGHALAAEQAGAPRLPLPVRLAMRAAATVMTTTARYV